jgi:SPP1 family predicted phage head-tail adaptor
MFFSDEIKLRAVAKGVDSEGYPTESNTDTAVFADITSATRSEFYSANANDIDITKVFNVHAEDYDGQRQVVYESKTYDVVRVYEKGLGVVELNCSDRGVDNG